MDKEWNKERETFIGKHIQFYSTNHDDPHHPIY